MLCGMQGSSRSRVPLLPLNYLVFYRGYCQRISEYYCVVHSSKLMYDNPDSSESLWWGPQLHPASNNSGTIAAHVKNGQTILFCKEGVIWAEPFQHWIYFVSSQFMNICFKSLSILFGGPQGNQSKDSYQSHCIVMVPNSFAILNILFGAGPVWWLLVMTLYLIVCFLVPQISIPPRKSIRVRINHTKVMDIKFPIVIIPHESMKSPEAAWLQIQVCWHSIPKKVSGRTSWTFKEWGQWHIIWIFTYHVYNYVYIYRYIYIYL